VDNVGKRLLTILQRGLASSLNEVFVRWDLWDIPRLKDRWADAKRRRATGVLDAERIERAELAREQRRNRGESREDRARWNRAASFRAPGRVT
jgi:hypothetical protein